MRAISYCSIRNRNPILAHIRHVFSSACWQSGPYQSLSISYYLAFGPADRIEQCSVRLVSIGTLAKVLPKRIVSHPCATAWLDVCFLIPCCQITSRLEIAPGHLVKSHMRDHLAAYSYTVRLARADSVCPKQAPECWMQLYQSSCETDCCPVSSYPRIGPARAFLAITVMSVCL